MELITAMGMEKEVLKIEHIHKKFDDLTVLEDVSLTVHEGEIIVIVGPSGCGKSTFLRCLNGLEEISEGHIYIDEEPVNPSGKNITKIRERIGMVFQSYDLFPHKTILENVCLAPVKVQKRKKDEVKEEALKLLERVGLSAKVNSFPRQLSGGQKQRVAIVRALIMHPEVLLFDEVTAALDPEMVREVLDVMLDLAKQKRTMLIVTHEMAFARDVADHIIFLDGGYVVEEGPAEQVINNPQQERTRAFLRKYED